MAFLTQRRSLLRKHRYLLGFAAAALILIGVSVAVILGVNRSIADSSWVTHTYLVLERVQRIERVLLEGISSQRSYVLTGQTSYREHMETVRPTLDAYVAELQGHVQDNPAQAQRVTRLGRLIEQRLDAAAEGVRIYETDGLAAAQQYLRANRGLTVMRQLEELAEQINSAEQALLKPRVEAARHSSLVQLSLGALGIPLSLIILGWIYVLLSREVRQRARAEREAGVANAQLHDTVGALREVSADLKELSIYTGMLQSCRSVDEVLGLTRQSLASMLPDCGMTIYLLRASQDYAEAAMSWGPQHVATAQILGPHDCWALRRGQPHALQDLRHGIACTHVTVGDGQAEAKENTATLCLPLAAQGTSLGFIFIASRGPLGRTAMLQTAAEQLALALTNLRLQESLRIQSIRDPLTGLYNRRYLEESLARELARCERRGLPLTLMMFDLDHFKQFNDSHGHDGGDALLAGFGQLLQTLCRNEDIPCRYGGEEFTLILPEMDARDALLRAEEIRLAVEVLSVRHLQKTLAAVTVSIGVALYPEHGNTGAELMRSADTALYRAKHGGRNRVEAIRALPSPVAAPLLRALLNDAKSS